MEVYICKIATLEEMEKNWNYLIEIHPNNYAWKIYKEKSMKGKENFMKNVDLEQYLLIIQGME